MKMSGAVNLLFSHFREDATGLMVRPMSWKGGGSAITLDADGRLLVLNPVDGEHYFSPFVYEITENWEQVKLKTMLEELEKNQKEAQ
jgi:hypothetical protein